MSTNDYKGAFEALSHDLSAIITLLGFDKYSGVDPVLRRITELLIRALQDPDPRGVTSTSHPALIALDKQCRAEVARAIGLTPTAERDFAWSFLLDQLKQLVDDAANTGSDGGVDAWRELLKRARDFVEAWDDDSQEFMDLCGDIDNALSAPAPGKASAHSAPAHEWFRVSDQPPEHNQWVVVRWNGRYKAGQFDSKHPFSPAIVDRLAGQYWGFNEWSPLEGVAPVPANKGAAE